jgi:DNA polymerase-3 subunit beta
MKITLPQDKLAKALSYTSRAVSTKPNIPVLSNILIEVNKHELKMSGTNLDMGINTWIAGTVEAEGKVTASGKFLSDFINATGSGKVEMSLDGDVLHVKTQNSSAEFSTISASEFPILPRVTGTPLFTISATDLASALDKVTFACAADLVASRIQFTGVLFELTEEDPSKLTLVGIDAYRLSRKLVKVEREGKEAAQLIVPARSLQELGRILSSEGAENVEVYLSESKSQIIFKFGDVELSVRLLEGPYPDYKPVIPVENAYGFDIAKSEMEQATKIVNTFARSIHGNRVDMDLDLESGMLSMRTTVAELGKNETKVQVKNVAGSNDLKSAYSLQFLIDMQNHMSGDTIHFESNGPLAAAVFTDPKEKDYIHLVMPLQRDDI